MNYLDLGINAIAVNDKKQAIFPWKEFQSRKITKDEFDKQMADGRACGVAIICGAISGGLEVIDFDLKYATRDIYKEVLEAIPKYIYDKIQVHSTKSNGKHWLYRCEVIEGNQKLAERYPNEEEKKSNPHIKNYCFIETRGEGGYVVAPPTSGYVSEKDGIGVLDIEEREQLFEILRSFNEVIDEAVIEAHNRPKEYGVSPFDDYNKRGDLRGLLEAHGWKVTKETGEKIYFLRPGGLSSHSGDFNKSLNLFGVFSTNTPFLVNKGYKPAAVYAILEHNSDFKDAAKALIDQGYGEKKTTYGDKLERELYNKRSDGLSKEDQVRFLVAKHNKGIDEATEIVENLDKHWGESLLTFWDVEFKNNKPICSINRYRLQTFLTQTGGFRLYFYDQGSTIYRLVRVKDGFVEEASTEQIKRFIKDYVDRLPDTFDGGVTPQDLLELIYKGASILFSDAFFEFFDRADIDFLKDTKQIAYFPFKNGVVTVGPERLELKSYGEIGKCVWKSQVIDHQIYINENIELKDIEFFRFVELISNCEPERYIYGLSLMGYLLHKYKDPSRPFAVILAEETENEAKGGGTGKGIFVKALGYLLNLVRVDGKNFKVDKNFAFQRVDLDTRILAIEDTRRNVDFEGFYSIITEGITVEKKNKDELFIPYKDSPKVIFTTNYTIPNMGNHAKRRQKVFEFAPYFGVGRTPEDEFKHKLFDDWDKDEWNRFFNLMFNSVQGYLQFGVQEVESSDKLKRKQIKVQFGEEFLEFLSVLRDEMGAWVSLESLYNQFLEMSGFDKKDYSLKRFVRAIEESCTILEIAYQNRRDKGQKNKKVYKFETSEKKVEDF